MRGEDHFFFPAKKISRFDRDLAEDLILSIDNPPFAWDFVGFC